MEAATLSATAACVAATAAWYANATAASREKRVWQRNSIVQAAAEVRDAYALWHFAEDHQLKGADDGGNSQAELASLENELRAACNRIGLARSRFTDLDAQGLYNVADAAWGDLGMVLFELRDFRIKHPDGGTYDGYRICGLEQHEYDQSTLDRLVRRYVTTRPQRLRHMLVKQSRQIFHSIKHIWAWLGISRKTVVSSFRSIKAQLSTAWANRPTALKRPSWQNRNEE